MSMVTKIYLCALGFGFLWIAGLYFDFPSQRNMYAINRLLTLIRTSTNAAEIDLHGVRQDLRYFIKQYKDGHRETNELISSEGLKTRQHISHEAKKTHEAVAQVDQKADRIVVMQESQVNAQARERFLQSLKFPGLNERRNRVDDAYGDSFKWVFAGDNEDDIDEATQSDYSHYSDEDSDSLYASNRGSDSDNELHGNLESGAKTNHVDGEDIEDLVRRGPSQMRWSSFSNWLSSTDVIYWISGKPGSGKTTLVKYILFHERTRKYLDIWSPGCMIISHYFWRPGSWMQKSLQGLYYSLLHQLLGGSVTALNAVRLSVTGAKDSHTDWSSAELRSAIWTALGAYDHGVCLFLDGIDEIDPRDESDPGIPEFLDWAFELSQMGKIKLCLVSRPDPYILEKKLSNYPRLRLQDLNYQDLMLYAKGHVDLSSTDMSKEENEPVEFVQSLVDKAEGVFLWLIFATRSINVGIENGDDADLLRERVQRLPKGLDNLYQDMWDRVGANSPLEYRQTAALYLRTLLMSPDLMSRSRIGLNLLTLLLATTSIVDEVLGGLHDSSKLVCQDALLRKCREVERKVNVYCFGLIEVVPSKRYDAKDAAKWSWYGRKYDSVLYQAYTVELQFIHRTARDFLTDTELGSKVLAFDISSGFALHHRLVKAWLATSAFFAHPFGNDNVDVWLHILGFFQTSWEGTDEWVANDWNNLVLLCETLANSGRLLRRSRFFREKITLCAGVDFLNSLARHQRYDQFVISRVMNGELTDNEKSEVLLNCVVGIWHQPEQPRAHAIRALLSAGADPNRQGCSQDLIFKQTLSNVFTETSWQRYLFHVVRRCADLAISQMDAIEFSGTLELILDFLTRGARLDANINLCINLCINADKSSYEPKKWTWVVTDIQSALGSYYVYRGEFLFASVPAHTIVRILIENVRYRDDFTQSHNWAMLEETLQLCRSLEHDYLNHHGGMVCRILGMFRRVPEPRVPEPRGFEFSWYETTEEMQVQLASSLMKWMMGSIERPEEPISHGEDNSEIISFEDSDTRPWILDDESWTLKCRSGRAIYERFEKMGMVTNIAGIHDFRPVERWVRKHNEEHNLD